jgi:hypothetical protein
MARATFAKFAGNAVIIAQGRREDEDRTIKALHTCLKSLFCSKFSNKLSLSEILNIWQITYIVID